MYEVIEGNRVRKMPGEKKPDPLTYGGGDNNDDYKVDLRIYNDELSKQPIYPISGPHPLERGADIRG